MNKLDLLKLARQNLWRRKLRTILTVLGVLIGTTSIVVMLSLGIGLRESQRKSMESWGSLTMIRVQQGMAFDNEGNPLGEAKRLNDEAVAEIKEIEGVIAVSPAYDVGGEARLGRKRGGLQLIGIDPEVMDQLEFKAEQGRLLKKGDRNVIVVGSQVIYQFQDESERRKMERGMMMYEDPRSRQQKDPAEMLDQRLSMIMQNGPEKKKNYNFMVVGILEGERNEHSYQAYAPIDDIKKMRDFTRGGSTQRGIGGSGREAVLLARSGKTVAAKKGSSSRDTANDYSFILVRTGKVEQTREVSKTIKDKGYNCWSMADSLEGIEKTSRTVQAVLGGIGAITLLVAALGITNTMIMSIYERTKEIGIMKVIGATFTDIHTLFLAEAGMIGFIGGLFGLGLSYGVSKIINHLFQNYLNRGMPAEEMMSISLIPSWLALFALLFSVVIGLVAGLYPAHRAVRLSPIRAIRNE